MLAERAYGTHPAQAASLTCSFSKYDVAGSNKAQQDHDIDPCSTVRMEPCLLFTALEQCWTEVRPQVQRLSWWIERACFHQFILYALCLCEPRMLSNTCQANVPGCSKRMPYLVAPEVLVPICKVSVLNQASAEVTRREATVHEFYYSKVMVLRENDRASDSARTALPYFIAASNSRYESSWWSAHMTDNLRLMDIGNMHVQTVLGSRITT